MPLVQPKKADNNAFALEDTNRSSWWVSGWRCLDISYPIFLRVEELILLVLAYIGFGAHGHQCSLHF
jgi:hypothetical protein